MSKAGYLQIKVAELENKLNKSSEKINALYDKLEKKETEIYKLIEKISPVLNDFINYEKLKEEALEKGKQHFEKEKGLFIGGVQKIIKKELKTFVSKDLLSQIHKTKENLNCDIMSFFIHLDILREYLLEVGVIDKDKFMDFHTKNYDKIYNMRLKQGNMITN